MLACAQHIPEITTLDFILLISLYLYLSIVLPKPSPAFFTLRVSQTNIIFTHTHLHSSTFFGGGVFLEIQQIFMGIKVIEMNVQEKE